MAKKIKKAVTKEEVDKAVAEGKIKPNLEPAGYKRREQLARRQDELQEAEETQSPNMAAIPESVLKEDREIDRKIYRDFFHLDMKPGWHVRFVNCVHQHKAAYYAARAEGYIPVSKEMVHKHEHHKFEVDNTIRVGDVIAMAVPIEVYHRMEEQREQRRLLMEQGIEGNIEDLASKHEGQLHFHSGLRNGNPHMDKMRKNAARQTALTHLGNQMKKGPIPGVPIK